MKRNQGFTLIETLVALAIIAIALTAALRASIVNIDSTHTMKLRTQASWVAVNQINLLLAAQIFPPLGSSRGQFRQGSNDFIWRQEVTITPNYSFRRVEVKVALRHTPDHILARQVSYVARKT